MFLEEIVASMIISNQKYLVLRLNVQKTKLMYQLLHYNKLLNKLLFLYQKSKINHSKSLKAP